MDQDTTYIGLDVSKKTIAVGIAAGGDRGEVRFYGSISSAPDAVARLVRTLATRHARMVFAYEAGPTGYGLHRQLTQLRSEEHTSELQSLMRRTYAGFCLQKKKTHKETRNTTELLKKKNITKFKFNTKEKIHEINKTHS